MGKLSDFRAHLRNCTDAQVRGVWEKAHEAGREAFAELAMAEADKRGLDTSDWRKDEEGTKISGVFSYMIPVYVTVEDGAVVSVNAIDETRIENPELSERTSESAKDDAAFLDELVSAAENFQDWPHRLLEDHDAWRLRPRLLPRWPRDGNRERRGGQALRRGLRQAQRVDLRHRFAGAAAPACRCLQTASQRERTRDMGTDIHFYVETRKDGRWHTADTWAPPKWKDDDNKNRLTVPFDKHFYNGRNYDLFAILADVRNGRGFAGVKTGGGFNIIAEPRGLPDDLCPELAAEAEAYMYHTSSWLLLSEILAFDWTQIATKQGVVSAIEFHHWNAWSRGRGIGPENYSGDIWGGSVIKVPESELVKLIAALGEPPTAEDVQEALPNHYTTVSWTEMYAHACDTFWHDTIPRLLRLGKPEDIRCVFWFNS